MKVNLIRKTKPTTKQPSVATIGNFDGLHKGHQQLIQNVVKYAKQSNSLATVITFEPMPQMCFRPNSNLLRLMSFRQKFLLLKEWGVDQVVCLRFNKAFSAMTPKEFVETCLIAGLNVKHLMVGEDFRFGFQQQGDVALLQQMGNERGFSVDAIKISQNNMAKISSTRVRELLLKGDLIAVEEQLGRNYQVSQRVVSGSRLARTLGYPTANLKMKPHDLAFKGVFVTKVLIEDKWYQAVTNVGTRPTLDGKNYFLEAHILDFSGDLYGKRITVEFLQKIRDEIRFADIHALTKQIAEDVNSARTFFSDLTFSK
ncbi:bifunctional riboflavin kinase/FAD synthetase [Candidatus Berkiella aquae]|nr:bifunctional riboflavin kinase/FAD synthetase [Candidatus Berkiella aquae]MCS5712502.1 bifunctional riboflavin kinase/FAD synthetase [Candidatus Berkiella aquae]